MSTLKSSGENLKLSSDNTKDIEFQHNGSTIVTIKSDGDVDMGTGDVTIGGDLTATGEIVSLSDKKFKDNIVTIPNALEKISEIRGVTFTRNDLESNKRFTGVIAQEVQAVLPEAVKDHNGTLTVAYGNMVGLLIEGMKEQQKQINELKDLIIIKGEK